MGPRRAAVCVSTITPVPSVDHRGAPYGLSSIVVRSAGPTVPSIASITCSDHALFCSPSHAATLRPLGATATVHCAGRNVDRASDDVSLRMRSSFTCAETSPNPLLGAAGARASGPGDAAAVLGDAVSGACWLRHCVTPTPIAVATTIALTPT